MVLKRTQPLSGEVSVTLTGGDGEAAVVFSPDNVFDKIPAVILSFAEDPGDDKGAYPYATSITVDGFTAGVSGTSAVSPIKLHWIALPRRLSERASQ